MAAGMGPVPGMGGGVTGSSATGGLQEVEHVRNVFPETWLWTNVSVRCALSY